MDNPFTNKLYESLVSKFIALGVPEKEARHPRLVWDYERDLAGQKCWYWYLKLRAKGNDRMPISFQDAHDLAAAHFTNLYLYIMKDSTVMQYGAQDGSKSAIHYVVHYDGRELWKFSRLEVLLAALEKHVSGDWLYWLPEAML